MESLFANIDPEDAIGLLLGGIALIGPLVIVCVAMFLKHQRKMAELFHNAAQQAGFQSRVESLESELRELRGRINQLILLHDDRRELQERVGPPRVPDKVG